MLRYVAFLLAIGLLVSAAVIGWSVAANGAKAADSTVGPGEQAGHHRSASNTPIVQKARPDRRVMLETICRVKGEGENIFTKDGKITLALHEDYAGYRMTQHTADMVNASLPRLPDAKKLAQALDRTNVEIAIPEPYHNDPVPFICSILEIQVFPQTRDEAGQITPGPFRSGKTAASSGGLVPSATSCPPVAPKPHGEETHILKDICRVQGEGENIFTKDGKITLVLCQEYASYRTGEIAADVINSSLKPFHGGADVAKALDPVHIEVALPESRRDNPVPFIADVLEIQLVGIKGR